MLALKQQELNLLLCDKPSINIAIVMDAVMTLAGYPTGWSNVLKVLETPNEFLRKLTELDVDSID